MVDNQPDPSASLDATEQIRLHRLYEGLREKLLDLTRRNRMLNYTFGARLSGISTCERELAA